MSYHSPFTARHAFIRAVVKLSILFSISLLLKIIKWNCFVNLGIWYIYCISMTVPANMSSPQVVCKLDRRKVHACHTQCSKRCAHQQWSPKAGSIERLPEQRTKSCSREFANPIINKNTRIAIICISISYLIHIL